MRLAFLLVGMYALCQGDPSIGTWTMNAARSASTGRMQPKSLWVRIEAHPKGELFTIERIETDGRMTTSSSILYFDSVSRNFQDFECSGTQSSRRIDDQTVEILRNCGAGAKTRFVRRTTPKSQLVLEISEQRADGRHLNHRLVFEKQ